MISSRSLLLSTTVLNESTTVLNESTTVLNDIVTVAIQQNIKGGKLSWFSQLFNFYDKEYNQP